MQLFKSEILPFSGTVQNKLIHSTKLFGCDRLSRSVSVKDEVSLESELQL